MKPNNLLYNYVSLVIDVPGPDALTALVDAGFRSWAMRQFRLAGVSCIDPRRALRGPARDEARTKLATHKKILQSIVMPDGSRGMNILLSPEKPSFAGTFCANVFMSVTNPGAYCVEYAHMDLFDVCSFMRDVCSEAITEEAAISFVSGVKPISFTR